MGKNNKRAGESERFGKCHICLGYIPIEYYFGVGDVIECYECGTAYIIDSKSPVKLSMADDYYEQDDYFGDMLFEDY
jgi:hypothetical protein